MTGRNGLVSCLPAGRWSAAGVSSNVSLSGQRICVHKRMHYLPILSGTVQYGALSTQHNSHTFCMGISLIHFVFPLLYYLSFSRGGALPWATLTAAQVLGASFIGCTCSASRLTWPRRPHNAYPVQCNEGEQMLRKMVYFCWFRLTGESATSFELQ